jgi:hypothetical protein
MLTLLRCVLTPLRCMLTLLRCVLTLPQVELDLARAKEAELQRALLARRTLARLREVRFCRHRVSLPG